MYVTTIAPNNTYCVRLLRAIALAGSHFGSDVLQPVPAFCEGRVVFDCLSVASIRDLIGAGYERCTAFEELPLRHVVAPFSVEAPSKGLISLLDESECRFTAFDLFCKSLSRELEEATELPDSASLFERFCKATEQRVSFPKGNRWRLDFSRIKVTHVHEMLLELHGPSDLAVPAEV